MSKLIVSIHLHSVGFVPDALHSLRSEIEANLGALLAAPPQARREVVIRILQDTEDVPQTDLQRAIDLVAAGAKALATSVDLAILNDEDERPLAAGMVDLVEAQGILVAALKSKGGG